MLSSCFGLPLRKGTSIIAIINSFASICYIFYYLWEYKSNYGYPATEKDFIQAFGTLYKDSLDEVFLNYITLVFMLAGFTSLYANFGLKQATLKNATHKIFFWIVIGSVQLGTVVTIEFFALIKHTYSTNYAIGLIVFSTFIDALMVFQLLVVQSYYVEEKLLEETNYSRLRSELLAHAQEQQMDDEFQNLELGAL